MPAARFDHIGYFGEKENNERVIFLSFSAYLGRTTVSDFRIVRYDWLRLVTIGYDWLRLATIGNDWLRLATIGYDW